MPEEEKLQGGLQVLQVRNIPIKHKDGAPLRSKCWKVTVEQKLAQPRYYSVGLIAIVSIKLQL